jgi:hypothetical protein
MRKGYFMRRKATAEQQEKALERRQKMRELAKRISSMSAEEREQLAARFPVVSIEGKALSPYNTAFIISQKPGATVVGGIRQWRAAGRYISGGKGCGLALWVPCAGEADRDVSEVGEVHEDKETGHKTMRFLLGTVFDVSDTSEFGDRPAVSAEMESEVAA